MQSMGIPHQPITAMFLTLQRASNHFLTAFGKSTSSYRGIKCCHTGLLPLMGAGQGNGAEPTAYATLSSAFIKVMALLGFGASFPMALLVTMVMIVCSMFVDNCDLWQTAPIINSLEESVAPIMQRAEQMWAGCLSATGGALSPRKSFWYLINYMWMGKEWRYRTAKEMPASITMADGNGKLHKLT